MKRIGLLVILAAFLFAGCGESGGGERTGYNVWRCSSNNDLTACSYYLYTPDDMPDADKVIPPCTPVTSVVLYSYDGDTNAFYAYCQKTPKAVTPPITTDPLGP